MSNCHICGSNNFTDELVSEIFKIREELILVEAIPAKVCSRCGEITFSSETAENIRLMLIVIKSRINLLRLIFFLFLSNFI